MKIDNLNSLNIAVRSFININDLIFPIKIDIKNIKDYSENEEFYKADFINNKDGNFTYSVNIDQNPFKDEIEALEIKNKLKFIYNFIDFELINYKNENISKIINKIYGVEIDTLDNFIEFMFFNENMYNENDIIKATYEINFYIGRVKNKFIEKAKLLFDWDRNFPKITLESDKKIEDNLKRFTIYPEIMTELQSASEYPMNIWFEENIGKAYNEWSWREKELKKIYISMKTRIENYTERMISFSNEQYAKNNSRTSRR